MMLANEARAMTEKAIEKEIASRGLRARQFCEDLVEEIKEACNNRQNEIKVNNVPYGLHSMIIGICKESGYVVTQLNDKTIVLRW